MIKKKEFRELDIDKQVELVNEELSKAKGTKNFGTFNLDFSYGFARTILTKENYDTLDEKLIDGIKVKLFRKMNEDELKEKEVKEIKKKEEVIEENNISNQTKIAKDIHLITLVISAALFPPVRLPIIKRAIGSANKNNKTNTNTEINFIILIAIL